VPGFDKTIDQDRAIQLLARLYWRRRIPGALLFSGIDGIGKVEVATLFAQTCNCLNQAHYASEKSPQVNLKIKPCGKCRACRKIASNTHPDIINIESRGLYIKIAQIRELRDSLAFKPNEAQLRVVILQKAQNLNLEASNALLKVLEEPPENTLFILTATHPTDLLPTIRSRCQQIRFKPMASKKIEAFLLKEKHLTTQQASVIASYAFGSPAKAQAYADSHWIEKRNWMIENLGLVSYHHTENRPLNVLFALGEELIKDKTNLEEYINVIKFWLSDLIICNYNVDYIINKDRLSDIVKTSKQMSEASVLEMITVLDQTMVSIKANANPRLILENLLLQLAGCNPKK
jgi:DNA polymerase-3 subunit delta'